MTEHRGDVVAERLIFPDATEQDTRGITSKPPSGGYKITRIWRNAQGNLEYEWEDVPEP